MPPPVANFIVAPLTLLSGTFYTDGPRRARGSAAIMPRQSLLLCDFGLPLWLPVGGGLACADWARPCCSCSMRCWRIVCYRALAQGLEDQGLAIRLGVQRAQFQRLGRPACSVAIRPGRLNIGRSIAGWSIGSRTIVHHQILLADISDVARFAIVGERMIERLVAARGCSGLDSVPFLAVGEDRIDIEHHAAKAEDAVFHLVADPEEGVRNEGCIGEERQ